MRLMRFTKGAVTYNELQKMPYSEIFKLNETANKVATKEEKEAQRAMKR